MSSDLPRHQTQHRNYPIAQRTITFNGGFCAELLFSMCFGIVRGYMTPQHSTVQIHSHVPPLLSTSCLPKAVTNIVIYNSVIASDTAQCTGWDTIYINNSSTLLCRLIWQFSGHRSTPAVTVGRHGKRSLCYQMVLSSKPSDFLGHQLAKVPTKL